MATRRDAREWATQILFQLDLNAPEDLTKDLDSVLGDFWATQLRMKLESEGKEVTDDSFAGNWRDTVAEMPIRKFAEDIVRGVVKHCGFIDDTIQKFSDNWDLSRMGGIERGSLRMGVYELLFRSEDIPAPVAINEAIDVCKFFGMRESGRFVNGILDAIAKNRENIMPSRDRGESWSPKR